MRKKILLFSVLVVLVMSLVAIGCPAPVEKPPPPVTPPLKLPSLLVDTEWLSKNLGDASLRIVDIRPAAKYAARHIPNSINVALGAIRPAWTKPVPEMILPQAEFETLMGGLGIGNNNPVVVVDETGDMAASRMFWTLEYYGHDNVAILDGGYIKWSEEGRTVTDKVPTFPKTTFFARPQPGRVATMREVLDSINKKEVIIVDARTKAEYIGKDLRAERGGTIPGAILLDYAGHFTTVGGITVFKPKAELRALYEAAGVTPDKKVIVFCHSGTRSSSSYFVLRLLDYPEIMNYDGSWLEWGNRPDTPIEKDGVITILKP